MSCEHKPRRVLIIGLDGATWTLLRPWAISSTSLPNIASLLKEGTYGILNSVYPVLSPPAWASFMTGSNPGQHGVYDFVQREPGSYQLRVVRADQIRRPTLWKLLSDSGRKVGVVNVPLTYPPEAVRGFVVSGLGTPDSRPFAYPQSLFERLRKQGYRVNKRVSYRPGQEAAFWAEVEATTRLQAQTALQLMESEPWDFFMFVFRDTDEIAHFFWRFIDESHPAHDSVLAQQWGDAVLKYYRMVDDWVGRMVAQAGPETAVFLISDHGSGPLYKDVFLNTWLETIGFLARRVPSVPYRWMQRWGITRKQVSGLLRRWNLTSWEIRIKDLLGEKISWFPKHTGADLQNAVDWSRTRAYSFGYHGQIYLNVRGREPQGIIQPGREYEQVRDELIEALKAWKDPDDHQPVVSQVFKREEIFQGPYLEKAPDLILVMRDFAYITRQGYEFGRNSQEIFAPPATFESGSHRLEGIVIARGAGIRRLGEVSPISIMDIAPTVLYLLDVAIPSWMDGQLLREWIVPSLLTQAPPEWRDEQPGESGVRDNISWTEEDEESVLERLRGLGYLG